MKNNKSFTYITALVIERSNNDGCGISKNYPKDLQLFVLNKNNIFNLPNISMSIP